MLAASFRLLAPGFAVLAAAGCNRRQGASLDDAATPAASRLTAPPEGSPARSGAPPRSSASEPRGPYRPHLPSYRGAGTLRPWLGADTTCVTDDSAPVVRCWGCFEQSRDCAYTRPLRMPTFERARAVAYGSTEICALTAGGALRCYHSMSYHRRLDGTFAEPSGAIDGGVKAIGGTGGLLCALLVTGAVRCGGFVPTGATLTRVLGLPPARSIAVSDSAACALDAPGVPWCWSEDDDAGLSRPARIGGLPALERIAVSDLGGCGVSLEGEIWCWDHGSSRPLVQPLPGRGIEVAIGAEEACASLDSGRVACFEPADRGKRADVLPELEGIVSLAGDGHFCAGDANGRLWCWGPNRKGQLGLGFESHHEPPRQVVEADREREPR